MTSLYDCFAAQAAGNTDKNGNITTTREQLQQLHDQMAQLASRVGMIDSSECALEDGMGAMGDDSVPATATALTGGVGDEFPNFTEFPVTSVAGATDQ